MDLALAIKLSKTSNSSALLKVPQSLANELGAMKTLGWWTKSLPKAPVLTINPIHTGGGGVFHLQASKLLKTPKRNKL